MQGKSKRLFRILLSQGILIFFVLLCVYFQWATGVAGGPLEVDAEQDEEDQNPLRKQ